MRSFILFSAILPAVLACDSASTDACASVFTASSAAAATMCATYTQAANTDVPSWASSACGGKPKHISSACSCLIPATLATVTATGVSNDTSAATTAPIASSGLSNTTIAVAAAQTTAGSDDGSSPSDTAAATTAVPSETAAASDDSSSPSDTAAATTAAAAATTAAAQATTAAAAAATTAAAVAGTACTVTDSDGISSAVASCTNIVLQDIAMPDDVALDLSDLQDGTTVTFAGNTSFGYVADSDFDPITVSGNNILITGAAGHVISGNGAAYWDGEGSNGGTDKPDHFFVVKDMTNSKIENLNIENWPVHCFDVTGADYLEITGLTLDNSAGDAPNAASGDDAAAHNSDGFDFSSCSNTILSNTVVKNQDDCVAVTSGYNVTVTGMTCSGGHGLSIGSVGGKSNNTVLDITFSDSTVTDSENGIRIKTNSGTTGTVTDITYSNITFSGITDYGIVIEQDYENGGATGTPTDGVPIDGVTITDVTGTVESDAVNIYILCAECSDWTFTDVSVTGGTTGDCEGLPTGISC